MTRYGKENRNIKEEKAKKIANILDINYNTIKKHTYIEIIYIIYSLMCLEELVSNYRIDLSNVSYVNKNQTISNRNIINK